MGGDRVTSALMNLAMIVEKADEGILPAVYMYIARSLNASLSQLGVLTLSRALVQALSSPLSGIIGDRRDRTHVVSFGALLWGVMTAGIGLSRSLNAAIVCCAINGFGLALVIPCVQSVIADQNTDATRGRAFGLMSLIGASGGMAGAFIATNIGGKTIMGLEGWRFAFHIVAIVSVITAALVYTFAVDPRRISASSSTNNSSNNSVGTPRSKSPLKTGGAVPLAAVNLANRPGIFHDIRTVVKIRSFQVIVLQGVAGMMPWQAIVMFTLWLQLLGFSDFRASTLMATFSIGCAVGSFFGGRISDHFARKYPHHGRIFTAQFSVLAGLPLSCLLMKGLPVGTPTLHIDFYASTYAAVFIIMGLSISWCGTINSAIFAELVPSQLRATVYAFDRSFESALAALTAPLVGLIAERAFGFNRVAFEAARASVKDSTGSNIEKVEVWETRKSNAEALSSALLVCLVVPWTLCFLWYTLLHFTYARDRAAAAGQYKEYRKSEYQFA